MQYDFIKPAVALLALLLAGCGGLPFSGEPAPAEPVPGKSPALSSGLCVKLHCDTWHSRAFPVQAPESISHRPDEDDVDFFWTSPIAGGLFDYTYPSGETVYWVPKADRVMKMRLDGDNNFREIAQFQMPTARFPYLKNSAMRAWIKRFDDLRPGRKQWRRMAGKWRGYQQEGLRAWHAQVTRDGRLMVASLDRVLVMADREPGNPDSAFSPVQQFVLDAKRLNASGAESSPAGPTPIIVGLSMLSDGSVVAVTLDGTLVIIQPDLQQAIYRPLPGETIWKPPVVDESDNIYVLSNRSLRKFAWQGGVLVDAPEQGAWTENYALGLRDTTARSQRGSGTPPVLMGLPGDPHRFVLITDGSDVNRAVLYWRDDIPEDWQALEGHSRRVAGVVQLDYGIRNLTHTYNQQAPAVLGYAAVYARTQLPDDEVPWADVQLGLLNERRLPAGLQQVRWDPLSRRFFTQWARDDVAAPNSVPAVASLNRRLLLVGPINGSWAISNIGWDSGETRAVYQLGDSQRFNPLMAPLQLLRNGDPVYHGFGGIVHPKLGY